MNKSKLSLISLIAALMLVLGTPSIFNWFVGAFGSIGLTFLAIYLDMQGEKD